MSKRDDAIELLKTNFACKPVEEISARVHGSKFCPEAGNFAVDHLFGDLWLRPGLDLRSRSLVTLGILMALRASDEIKVHAVVGVKNGLTVSEIQEVIYHAIGYLGFPAVNTAMEAAATGLRMEGLIE